MRVDWLDFWMFAVVHVSNHLQLNYIVLTIIMHIQVLQQPRLFRFESENHIHLKTGFLTRDMTE